MEMAGCWSEDSSSFAAAHFPRNDRGEALGMAGERHLGSHL